MADSIFSLPPINAMMPPEELQALHEGHHANPFERLGIRREAGHIIARALFPQARRVHLVVGSGEPIMISRVGFTDVFAHTLPTVIANEALRGGANGYRWRVEWTLGDVGEYADPYAFTSDLNPSALTAFSQGANSRVYELLGAHPQVRKGIAGVRFATWAPNAQRVSVVGNFNGWDGRRHIMRRHPQHGVWDIFIPHIKVGDHYKFEILSAQGTLLPLKADPFAFASEHRPNTASIVAGLPTPPTINPKRQSANGHRAPISVYEVHATSWRTASQGESVNWEELTHTLPEYAKKLGFTHIQLMPISEYPLDDSWGYQPIGLFSPTARLGAREGLQHFVSQCHQLGLGVILDWVPAHFPADAHGLAQFDGTALYEYADLREGYHQDWHTLIYNFSRHEVRSFLVSSAVYWLACFGVDGLRIDAVSSMLYRDYSRKEGEWIPNYLGGRENLEAISLLQYLNQEIGVQFPHAITIAEESTAFPKVSAPVHHGGLGFHYKWNMGWMHDTLDYLHHEPIHRAWHHHQLTFGLVYAFSEQFILALSHDEVVHGKGSLINKIPGDEWQQRATLRAYFGFMWAHPGKKHLFMGGEWGERREWNHRASLDWDLAQTPTHQGISRLIGELNHIYRTYPVLHEEDHHPEGFEWLLTDAEQSSVYAWLRKGANGQPLMIVSHFTPLVRDGFVLGLPDLGISAWREIVNTDASIYGGSGVGNLGATIKVHPHAHHHHPQNLVLTLPPLSTLYLAPA